MKFSPVKKSGVYYRGGPETEMPAGTVGGFLIQIRGFLIKIIRREA